MGRRTRPPQSLRRHQVTDDPARILIGPADRIVVEIIAHTLRGVGLRVSAAVSEAAVLHQAAVHGPDLVILGATDDMGLLHALRRQGRVPILVVGDGWRSDAVRWLDAGADAYVANAFGPEEVRARVQALLRCTRLVIGRPRVQAGAVEIDLVAGRVTRADEPLALTAVEWRLLRELASAPGRVVLYRQLLLAVWGPDHLDDLDNLRNWIRHLRTTLGAPAGRDGAPIRTYAGIGYGLDTDVAEAATPALLPRPAPPDESSAPSPAPAVSRGRPARRRRGGARVPHGACS